LILTKINNVHSTILSKNLSITFGSSIVTDKNTTSGNCLAKRFNSGIEATQGAHFVCRLIIFSK